jgi:hypothetical protein
MFRNYRKFFYPILFLRGTPGRWAKPCSEGPLRHNG